MAALEECKEIFHTMDRNHHGEVNVRDLIIALRKSPALSKFLHLSQKVKQEGSARTLQKLFEDIDADHGNTISWQEFQNYFKNHIWDKQSNTFVEIQSERNTTSENQPSASSLEQKIQSRRRTTDIENRMIQRSDIQDDPNGIASLRKELAQLHMEFASLQIPTSPQNSNPTSLINRSPSNPTSHTLSPTTTSLSSSKKRTATRTATTKSSPSSSSSSQRVFLSTSPTTRVTTKPPTQTVHQSRPEDLAQTKLYSRIQILEEQARSASEDRTAQNNMIKELAGRVDAAIRLVTDSIKASSSSMRMENRVTKLENRLKIMETSIIKEQENTLRSLELLLRFKDGN